MLEFDDKMRFLPVWLTAMLSFMPSQKDKS
jgi:hypothetical protein